MPKPKRGAAARTSSTSKRDLAPPELRYQFLRAGPGRSPWALRGLAGGIGVAAVAALSIVSGRRTVLIAVPVIVFLLNGLFRGVTRLLDPSSKNARSAPVGIVPWGIVIDPDGAPVAVPWPRLREVSVTRVHRDEGRDDPRLPTAIMRFDTDAGVVRAQGEEGEWVSSVEAFHARFARAAARGPAADLDGIQPLETGGLPASLALLRRAEGMLDSADGRAALGLEAGDYRSTSSRAAGPETRAALRDALWRDGASLDAGPLAAILVAELGIDDLLPDLLRLILSASPLLAGTARAAAIRLGASPAAAGSLAELEHFLPRGDIEELQRWIDAAPRAA